MKYCKIILIVLGLLSLGFVFQLWLINYPIVGLNRNYVYSESNNLELVENGTISQIKLNKIKNHKESLAIFCIYKDRFIYFSNSDKSLYIWSNGKETKKYLLPEKFLKSDDWWKRITANDEYVVIEGNNISLLLALKNNKWLEIPYIKKAHILSNKRNEIIGITNNNKFAVYNIDNKKMNVVFDRSIYIIDFDYDYKRSVIYALSSHDYLLSINISNGNIKKTKMINNYCGMRLFYQPKYDEIWVTGHCVFSVFRMIAYDKNLRYLGAFKHSPTSSFYCLEIDKKGIELLKKAGSISKF